MGTKLFAKCVPYVIIASALLQLCRSHEPSDASQLNSRTKRQTQDAGNQIIDNIFKIPITTLTAVSDLIKSTRPVVREVRRRAQQQYNQYQDNRRKTSTTYQYIDLRLTTPRPTYNRRQSHAASVAGVYQSYDGTRYRI